MKKLWIKFKAWWHRLWHKPEPVWQLHDGSKPEENQY